jgi:hypothetical protein
MLALRVILIGLVMFQSIFSQKPVTTEKFSSPLDIPLYLSGNFGELRPDHFHSGLDFKTQGVTGKSVYAVAEGYVSRIKIQTNGYGNSIYITHPGGITSVYGHLERYNDSIAKYVKHYQYQKKSQTIDIYPDKDLFRVQTGDIIAFSGNTGGSAGPHLHFELRGTGSQHPLNPLLYGFDVKDNLPPQLYNLYIYPLSETQAGCYPQPKAISLNKGNGTFHLNSQDTITLKGSIGFGLETSDFLNDISNQCGIYSIELFVNDVAVFVYRIDEFSFAESPYINALADYRAMMEKNKKIYLLYRKPNNRLSLYPLLVNDGIINFNPGETSKVGVRVTDAYSNTSELSFFVKAIIPSAMIPEADSATSKLFVCGNANYYENAQMRLSIPANSLYDDCVFNYARVGAGFQSFYPFTHYVGDSFTPLFKPAVLSFLGDMIPPSIRSKTVVAMLDDKNNVSCLYSTWNGDRVSASTYKLGKFTLVVDTIAPTILPLNIKQGTEMKSQSSIRFKITDELSGISDYQGLIDKEWALFEYDPKNEVIVYTFDSEKLISGIGHELKLIVKDAVGNQKTYETSFTW